MLVSISGEKPIPWRRKALAIGWHIQAVSISGEKPIPWRRGAGPRNATRRLVSISGEKPIPWRPLRLPERCASEHMFQSQARSQSPGDRARRRQPPGRRKFQSQARSQSPGDGAGTPAAPGGTKFQSQARSQSPGDKHRNAGTSRKAGVSISGEKPIPWRHQGGARGSGVCLCFNLRREANPLATVPNGVATLSSLMFQSQARSQSPGDVCVTDHETWGYFVSISGEKPIPWRRRNRSARAR